MGPLPRMLLEAQAGTLLRMRQRPRGRSLGGLHPLLRKCQGKAPTVVLTVRFYTAFLFQNILR
jgi:hypothetical protein